MSNEQKLYIEYCKLLGQFEGTLKGIAACDIPNDLKEKLLTTIEELSKINYEQFYPIKDAKSTN